MVLNDVNGKSFGSRISWLTKMWLTGNWFLWVCLVTEYPLVTWQNATQDQTDVVHVKWCRSRPSVFFVVDSAPCLSIWDLQLNLTGPVKSEPFAKSQYDPASAKHTSDEKREI